MGDGSDNVKPSQWPVSFRFKAGMAHPERVRPAPAQDYDPNNRSPVTFDEVLRHELDRVRSSREQRGVSTQDCAHNLTGLAFSGGGIRSATFNLGILQALAQKGLLHRFDYLSTVSGGGYIGSWLAALTLRLTKEFGASFSEVERSLSPQKYEPDRCSEAPLLRWLRLYSNYLSPHKGFASGDTWTMVGTWLHNVLFKQIIFGLLLMSVFVLCQAGLLPLIGGKGNGMGFMICGVALLFLVNVSMAINVLEQHPGEYQQTPFQRIKIKATVMLPFAVACVLLNCALWRRTVYASAPIWSWALAGAAFYFVVWGVVATMAKARSLWRRNRGKPSRPVISIVALVNFSPWAGAAGGCLLRAYTVLLSRMPESTSKGSIVMVLGSATVMLITVFVAALHSGLVGMGSTNSVRESWSRLNSQLLLLTALWLVVTGTSEFGPWLISKLLLMTKHPGNYVLLWFVLIFVGVVAARSGRNREELVTPPEAKGNCR